MERRRALARSNPPSLPLARDSRSSAVPRVVTGADGVAEHNHLRGYRVLFSGTRPDLGRSRDDSTRQPRQRDALDGDISVGRWQDLQRGVYVLICRVQAPDSVAHLKKGMVSLLTVNATTARTAAEPDPTTLAGGVTPFKAGTKVWLTLVFNPGKCMFSDELGGGKDIFRQIIVW